jgi:hypothetical protein
LSRPSLPNTQNTTPTWSSSSPHPTRGHPAGVRGGRPGCAPEPPSAVASRRPLAGVSRKPRGRSSGGGSTPGREGTAAGMGAMDTTTPPGTTSPGSHRGPRALV